MNRRRLYRCSHDRILAGVASGVAEYFELDPSLVRILWVISMFFGGLTLFLYIAMAIVVPVEPDVVPAYGPWQPGSDAWGSTQAGSGEQPANAAPSAAGTPLAGQPGMPSWHVHPYRPEPRRRSGYGAWFFGIVLILFGALALADQYLPAWADHGRFLWPAFVLGVGVLLVVVSIRRNENAVDVTSTDRSQTES